MNKNARYIGVLTALAAFAFLLTGCGVDLEGDDKTIDPTNTVQVADKVDWVTTAVPEPTDDELFIGALDHFGIYYSSEASAISVGGLICETLATGEYTSTQIMWELFTTESDADYSMQQIGELYQSAVNIYCPWESEIK